MEGFGIGVGVFFVLIGLSAIIFKKYPGKAKELSKLQKEYGNINTDRYAVIDGVFYILSGLLFFSVQFFRKMGYSTLITLYLPLLILLIAYYFVKTRFLRKR